MKNYILLSLVSFLFVACSAGYQDAVVTNNGKDALLNSAGEMTIKDSYDELIIFSEDYLKVKVNEKYGLIDESGQLVLKPYYDEIFLPYNGYIKINENGKYGLLNQTTMNIELKPIYDSITEYENNLFIVQLQGLYGCVKDNLEFVIEPKYDNVYAFYEGIARVKIDNKYGF